MKCRYLFTCLLIPFASRCVPALAQALPDTNTLFPRNFVTGDTTLGAHAGQQREFTPAGPSLDKTGKSELSNREKTASSLNAPAPSSLELSVTNGKSSPAPPELRQFVSVYVNSADRAHCIRVLDQVLELHTRGGAHIAEVFHIGNYQNISPESASQFARAGVQITALSELPSHLQGLTSPVWEVFTNSDPAYVSGIVDGKRVLSYIATADGVRRHD